MRVVRLLPLAAAPLLAGCTIPHLVDSIAYSKDCPVSTQPPPADELLFVTVRLRDCRHPPNMPMTFYRGIGAMYGSVDRELRMTFYPKETWDAARLERIGNDRSRTPVLFIHGYNYSHDESLRRAFAVTNAIGPDYPVIALTWPSYASKRRYVWDEANAEWSFPATRAIIEDLASRGQPLVMVAHSMGNRIALDAVRHYRIRTGARLPLRRLIMASPDVDRQQVRDMLVDGVGAPVTIYASTEDQPLSMSWRVHGLPRAGDLSTWVTGQAPYYYFSGIPAVEIVNTAAVRRDVLGHSDFIETEQGAGDLCRVVRGFPKKGRDAVTNQEGYWTLTRAQPEDWCRNSAAFAVRTLLQH